MSTHLRLVFFVSLLPLLCNISFSAQPTVVARANQKLQFTENKGQWHSNVLFRTEIPNGNVLFEKNAFYFFCYSPEDLGEIHHPGNSGQVPIRGHAFREEFIGANQNVSPNGNVQLKQYANYFLGSDRSHWAGGVKIFSELNYKNLYNGIDMRVYSNEQRELRYDFIVNAGNDASQIKILYRGAERLEIADSKLQITTSVGNIIEEKPFTYQEINGFRKEVKCNFVLEGNKLHFEFPDGYNRNIPLIIDPNIVFSTYTGSTADNWGYTATYDAQGCLYLGGYVNATPPNGPNYPTTIGAFQTVWGGGSGGNNGTGNGIAFACDMGITKFTSDGTQLVYSTYLGGSDNDTPHSLVVDAQGNLIVYGVSYSPDFPATLNAYDNTYNGNGDIVVTKFNSTGTSLIGSTYVGGISTDGINFDAQEFTSGNLKRNYGDQNRGEINIDAALDIYVASVTMSTNFPVTTGAFQASFGGGLQDGCAFKLSSDCSQLLWSTYLGGSGDDACYSLDVSPAGTLFVAGGTMSNNFPTTAGTLHPGYLGGLYDGFLAQINATGTALLASSYIGTAGDDQVYFVKLDAASNVYCVGQTTGAYPVFNAPYSNANSGQFILKTSASLNTTFYSTVFGNSSGLPNISPTAFLVDTCENVYVAGWGCTANGTFGNFANPMFNMPLTNDAFQSSTDGTDFYFFVLAKNAQNILYGSYFGGNGAIEHVDGGTSRFDKRGVIYEAMCAGCGGNSFTPTTPGVWSTTNQSSNCNELGLKMAFNLGGTQVDLVASPRATGCVPLTVQFHETVSNAQYYTWDFGDGSTATGASNPLHTYTDTGTYHVMLVGYDSNSCNLTDTAFIDVWVRDDSISANFLPNVLIDCDSNKVFVSADGYATTSFLWNMGDASSYNTDSVSHFYASAGDYNITLFMTDTTRCNLADTFSTQVHIPQHIDAVYSLSDSLGCVPLSITFNTTLTGSATCVWNFGDGTTSTLASDNHTYNAQGNYLVSLIVTDTTSCNINDTVYASVRTIDSSANADFNFSRIFFGCDSVQVKVWTTYIGEDSQLWDFGDGTQVPNIDSASHTYSTAGTFTITHYITDADMICKPLDTSQIVVSLLPLNISLTIADTGGCLPFTANFTGNSPLLTTDFTWFFGDGTSATGDVVSHTYNSVGTFSVTVLGVDTNACVGADSAFATIVVINDSVHADFNLQILNACDSNLVISVVNASTNAVNYFWDFGDGTISTNQNELHSYQIPGSYVVTLVATDTNRCHPVDSISKPVSLLPNAFVEFTTADVCLGTTAQFINLSNPSAQFLWILGDGTTTTQYSPSHDYTQIGLYAVQLIIIDSSTCNVRDTVAYGINVMQQPIADFITTNDTFAFEKEVEFINKSLHYTDLVWNFGDGVIDKVNENPTHVYETLGWMHVCLLAENGVCYDTICKGIFISFTALIGVPNAFTPNGDGINDVVKVEGRGIEEIVFRIFNRWGEKVFESRDRTEGWNGYYKGELQEMDVFTYTVEAKMINGEIIPLKGNVTLLR